MASELVPMASFPLHFPWLDGSPGCGCPPCFRTLSSPRTWELLTFFPTLGWPRCSLLHAAGLVLLRLSLPSRISAASQRPSWTQSSFLTWDLYVSVPPPHPSTRGQELLCTSADSHHLLKWVVSSLTPSERTRFQATLLCLPTSPGAPAPPPQALHLHSQACPPPPPPVHSGGAFAGLTPCPSGEVQAHGYGCEAF